MVNNKAKASRKSIRKQRWAAVVAGVIAVGMLVSSVFVYFDNMAGSGRAAGPDQNMSLEDYLAYYKSSAEQLEAFIEEHGPTKAVLESLLESYNYLLMFQQLSGESGDIPVLQEKMIGVYQLLIELAPDELRYRLDLLYAYKSIDADEETILAQAELLGELLRENPASYLHLQLINFLASVEGEELLQEEIAWFSAYLEQRIEDETADNIDRYCMAVLAAEYLEDIETAYAQLARVMETEEEGSSLYNQAKQYQERLTELEDDGGSE